MSDRPSMADYRDEVSEALGFGSIEDMKAELDAALSDAARERERADRIARDAEDVIKTVRRVREQAEAERDRLAARVVSLKEALAEAAIPLEAFHMGLGNAWELSDAAKAEIRNAVAVIREALRGAGEEAGDGDR